MTRSGSTLHAALAAFAAVLALAGHSQAAFAKKMTCTFIAQQCVKECSKEVSKSFCQDFCGMERQNCLTSGNWETMGRKFSNVIKK